MTQSVKTLSLILALQYERLALAAFDLCNSHITQLDALAALVASIHKAPSMTRDERHCQRRLVELLIETTEAYQREAECDHQLFQVIALDARGIPNSRITASRAARLLAEAAKKKEKAAAKRAARYAGTAPCKSPENDDVN